MWQKAYKVLSSNGELESVGPKDYRIKYQIGKEHHPMDGTIGLFVFDTLANALQINYGRVVHECVVFNAKKIDYIGDVFNVSGFYDEKQKNYKNVPPEGTLVCDKLILLDKICDK